MTEENKQPMIVVFPRGQLKAVDRERLESAGVIAIEADDPKSVQQVQLSHPLVATNINGDALVRSALAALASQPPESSGGYITASGRGAHKFVSLLSAALEFSGAQTSIGKEPQ